MLKTYSCGFAGGDLAGWGYEAAGLEPINLFELEPHLAEVGQANTTGKYIVGDIRDVNFSLYEAPDLWHVSPVCTRASVANPRAGEELLDMQMAEASMRAVAVWRPRVVVVENVWQYRTFKAFRFICHELMRLGYGFREPFHLCAADFGTPQTRRRLFLVAALDGRPEQPSATHAENPVGGSLFGEPLEKWVGWYEAIEDLIPTLPESKFAEWQLERLKNLDLSGFGTFVCSSTEQRDFNAIPAERPIWTQTASAGYKGAPRALLVGDQHRQECVCSEPAFTVTANGKGGTEPRALIVEGSASGENNAFTLPVRNALEPVFTMRATQNNPRAWLETGRVVQMTPRALARFMGLPDTYQLSGNRKTDCTVLGNGVCPQVTQAIAQAVQQAA